MLSSEETVYVDMFIQELEKEGVDANLFGLDLRSTYFDVEDLSNDDLIGNELLQVIRRCKARAQSFTNFSYNDIETYYFHQENIHKIWT